VAVLAGAEDDPEHEQQQSARSGRGEQGAPVVLAAEVVEDEREHHDEQHQDERRARQPPEGARGPQLEQLGADEPGHRPASVSPVSSRNTSSRLCRGRYQLEDRDAVLRGGQPDRLERCVAHREPVRTRAARVGGDVLGRQRRAQPLGVGAAHPHRRRRPPGQFLERALGHQPAAADHDHLVDGLRHLGQHVARDQHGATVGGARAQEVPQAADALRVGPFAGSSSTSARGSPSSAPARLSRCRMPSE
jgi:hypothetical protein